MTMFVTNLIFDSFQDNLQHWKFKSKFALLLATLCYTFLYHSCSNILEGTFMQISIIISNKHIYSEILYFLSRINEP